MNPARALLLVAAVCTLQAQELSRTSGLRIIHKGDPKYTEEALQAKLQGEVRLSTLVGADGAPDEIKVSRGLGKGLDEKAIECLRQWRFAPATDHEKPVPITVNIIIAFRLPK